MRIKKFNISYGGYLAGNEQFFKKGRDIIYHSEDIPFPPLGKTIPVEAVRIRPDKREWKLFLASVRCFPTYWRKEYFNHHVDDGIQWEVKIITDDFTFKSHGSNAFPDDFEDFLSLVRQFTGVQEFAYGFASRLFMFD
jgi:hypothetical protein